MRKKPAKRRRRAKPRQTTNRTTAIQRAIFTPRTRMVEFVHDETYFLASSGLKGNNSTGLRFNLGNPFETAVVGLLAQPFWGGFSQNTSSNMSGAAYSDPPHGWSRWMGFGTQAGAPAPYRQCTVVGATYTARFEQLHKAAEPPVDPAAGVKAFSVFARVAKDGSANPLTTAQADITKWQNCRGITQRNMTPIHVGQSLEANSVAQQCSITGSYNAKTFHGIKDLRDNFESLSGQYAGENVFTPPTDDAFLQLAMVDRLTSGAHGDNYIMPDMLIRVKINFKCMLTQANRTYNRDQVGV